MPGLSQFYILSARGDCIIFRDFRHDVIKTSAEIFFRNCKFYNGKQAEAPPIFNIDSINYIYLKKNGLYFVLTTRDNLSPNYATELLIRLTKIFKDYCGVLSEESIRTNFVLLYELLDEIIDFGYIINTNTEQVKSYVFNDPVIVKSSAASNNNNKSSSNLVKFPDLNPKTTPSTSVDKPISYKDSKGKGKKNEIFVDIYERINITFNSNGYILNNSIDGTIQMKSYLAGNPELKLALNEELVIGKSSSKTIPQYGIVEVDDCNFHECVKLNEFEQHKILNFLPPDGEFVLMNYRITSDFRAPFRIFPFFDLISPYKVELIIKIRADIPEQNYGGNVLVNIPMPKNTSTVNNELSAGAVGQSAEYDSKERKINWRIKKFNGGTEQTLKCRITLNQSSTASIRKEIGPISLSFEIPMYNPSGLQVRYLRILEDKSYNPYRWVRYVTKSQSYVCRL
jgi:AP-4 complex subunit mu-1